MNANTEHERDQSLTDENTIRDGDVIIDERMNRREGLAAYEGTVDATQTPTASEANRVLDDVPTSGRSPAMQAGATILGGTGSTALVDDGTTMSEAADYPTGETSAETMSLSRSDSSNLDRSTDNTAAGGVAADTMASGPIGMVREKMKVVDANGDELGKVDYVHLGDPQAATTAGQTMDVTGNSLVEDAAMAFGGGVEPSVDEPLRSQLLRTGFVKIDGKGWFGSDRYVPADQIASVSGDTVTLSATKETLPEA